MQIVKAILVIVPALLIIVVGLNIIDLFTIEYHALNFFLGWAWCAAVVLACVKLWEVIRKV